MNFTNTLDALDFANTLYETGLCAFAVPDLHVVPVLYDDPLYPGQFQMNSSYDIEGPDGLVSIDCNAPEAWAITEGDNQLIVAVFDSGGEAHEDMEDDEGNSRMLQGFNNAWFLPGEGDDPENWFYGEINPFGGSPHGMATSGIIGASHNELGVRGIAPKVKIMPVNIFWNPFNTNFVEPYYLAAELGAAIMSNSWGFASCEFAFDPISTAIHDVTISGRGGLGCVVVFASGNGDIDTHIAFPCVGYPANLPDVIAVGAIGQLGAPSTYSNYGNDLDLVAPSASTYFSGNVVTIDRMGELGYNEGNYVTTFGGTSAACPVVAGTAALVLSEFPEMTDEEVRERLYCAASDLGSDGWDENYGHGLVNAEKALLGCNDTFCDEVIEYDYDYKIVYGDETFVIDEDMSFYSGIEVQSGGALTITNGAVVSFGPNAKILIKSGGVADIQANSVLTTACNAMWQGIEVRAYDNSPYQGSLTVNESTIENAHLGITMGGQTGIFYAAWRAHNGILQCTGNHFLNCGIGIFIPPTYLYLPMIMDDIAITGNTFETAADVLLNNVYDYNWPYVTTANGLPWLTSTNSEGRGAYGIFANTAMNIVVEDNNFFNLETGIGGKRNLFDIRDCFFQNLQYGINLSNPGYPFPWSGTVTIEDCTFQNIYDPAQGDQDFLLIPNVMCSDPWNCDIEYEFSNTAAIRVTDGPNIHIYDNTFGEFLVQDYDQHVNGIYLEHCSDYTISNGNYFYNWQRGVVVIDTDSWFWGNGLIGPEDLGIDKNFFVGCYEDVVTGGDNFNFLLRCNEFVHGEEESTFWQNAGVLSDQGYEPEDENDATSGAGNRFYPANDLWSKTIANAQTTEGGMFDPDNEDQALAFFEEQGIPFTEEMWEYVQDGFGYYHHGNNDQDNPFRPSVPEASDTEIAALNIAFDENNSCDSPFNILGEDGDDLVLLASRTDLASKIEAGVEELEQIAATVDNFHSQTSEMLDAIYGGITNDHELMQFLRDNSPLSKEVLEAYMLRYNVPSEYFYNVFELNSVIDAGLHELLRDRVENMPEAIKNQILSVYLVNPEIETVSKLSRRIMTYQKIYQAVVLNEVNQLVASGNTANAAAILEEQAGIHPKILLLNLQLSSGNFTAASATLASIPDISDDMVNWKVIKQIELTGLMENSEPDYSAILENLSYNFSDESFALATSLLELNGLAKPLLIPKALMSDERKQFGYFEIGDKSGTFIYPNPVVDYCRIHTSLPSQTELDIILFDPQGKVVFQKQFRVSEEDILLEIENLAKGDYTFRISTGLSTIASGILVVQ